MEQFHVNQFKVVHAVNSCGEGRVESLDVLGADRRQTSPVTPSHTYLQQLKASVQQSTNVPLTWKYFTHTHTRTTAPVFILHVYSGWIIDW